MFAYLMCGTFWGLSGSCFLVNPMVQVSDDFSSKARNKMQTHNVIPELHLVTANRGPKNQTSKLHLDGNKKKVLLSYSVFFSLSALGKNSPFSNKWLNQDHRFTQ